MALISDTTGSAASVGLDDRTASIFGEQVRLLYRLSRPAYAGTLINAVIIVLALWNVTPLPWLAVWLALVTAVTTWRFALYKTYFARELHPPEAPAFANRFVAGAIAMGCLWGVLGSVLLPQGEIMHQFLIVFVVGGMVASALVVLTPIKPAFLGFMLPALLPLTITILLQGSQMHLFMGVLLLVFAAVMLGAFPIMHETHVASLRTGFENSELVARLSVANHEAAGSNRQMAEQIQQQKKIEEQLHQSTERVEALIEASPLAIIVQDERGIVKRWNPAAERMFGWTEQEAVGRIAPSIPADKQDEAARFRDAILRGEQFADVEAVRQRKNGSLISVSISASPLRNAAGTPNGMVVMIADIGERKKGEQLQRLDHAVTKLLSESRSVEEAMPQVLRAVAEISGWMYGARWVLNHQDQRLQCLDVWHVDQPEIATFAEMNRKRRVFLVSSEGGLLSNVWNTGNPAWISDVAQDSTLARAAAALRAGLHSAFAFPVLIGGKSYGVMEFFAAEARARDDALMEISTAIGTQVGQFFARKEAESHLFFFANHDSLTGLPNRVMFNQRLTQALARAQRHRKMAALLFVDLDRFKIINDTLGHDAGDHLLKRLAVQLRDCLRESDTIGRQGGDEFVVLVEDVADPNQVAGVAHKILETVARPCLLSGQEFHVTGSIGISIYPDDGADSQTLLKYADIAMYRAKEQGRNNFQFYSPQMNLHTFERLALETSLRRAVERQEFLLHYQPKVDVRSGQITGVEALVRWRHPDLGMVPPAQFIPLAEETGLIEPIGEWVLRTACGEAQAWVGQGLPGIGVAVNLSARQFEREDWAAVIIDVLRETGLDPGLLELEITESAVMQNADRAARLLQQLKQMGVRIAIDDFGAGYSSLSHLKRFPIDSVKIDRSFIRDIPGDKDDVAIICAVIAMAHSLRLKVTAEGVEFEEQYRFLRDHDCDEMQGHYCGAPVGAAALIQLLRQPRSKQARSA